MQTKDLVIWGAVAGGIVLMGCAGTLLWNSKKMKTARALHRTAGIMKTTGDVLQSVAHTLG